MKREYPGSWVIRPEVLPSVFASGFSSVCRQLQLRGQHRYSTDFLSLHGLIGVTPSFWSVNTDPITLWSGPT